MGKTTRKTKTGRRWLLLAVAGGSLAGWEKPSKKKAFEGSALLAGTVFHSSGLALRGAEVVISAAASSKKRQEWRAVSDARGEFAIRLPAGAGSYNVVVKAAGFATREKSVTIGADERVDLSFLLDPAPEKK